MVMRVTMEFLGRCFWTLLGYLGFSGILRFLLIFFEIFWDFLGFFGILWDSRGFLGFFVEVLCDSLRFSWILLF